MVEGVENLAARLNVGNNFLRLPRVSLVYFIRPFGVTASGWPTKQLGASERSRALQFSMMMRSPLQR